MARSTWSRQVLLLLALLALARADPSSSREANPSLRGGSGEAKEVPSKDTPAAQSSAAGQGVEPNASVVAQKLPTAAQSAESLIVCRGAKVCRGAWISCGGRRVCRGGFYCRGWAALVAEDARVEEHDEAVSAAADLKDDGAEVEGGAFKPSELMAILTSTSRAAESLVVCRGARVCRGGWTWHGRARVCRGGFSCSGGVHGGGGSVVAGGSTGGGGGGAAAGNGGGSGGAAAGGGSVGGGSC